MGLLANITGERELNISAFYNMDIIGGCMMMCWNRKGAVTIDLRVG